METRSIESRDTTSMKIHWSRLETEWEKIELIYNGTKTQKLYRIEYDVKHQTISGS